VLVWYHIHNFSLSRIKTLKAADPPQQSAGVRRLFAYSRGLSPPAVYRDVRYRYNNNARATPLQRVRVLDRDHGVCVCLSDFPVSEIRPPRSGAIIIYNMYTVVYGRRCCCCCCFRCRRFIFRFHRPELHIFFYTSRVGWLSAN